jgi:quercetin dioxygenase-like cupin family protein
MAEIANRKVFENDRVAVWEMYLEPGESTGLHTHTNTYFFQVIEGSTLKTLDADGTDYGDLPLAPGDTVYVDVEGDRVRVGDLTAPATHEAVNVGDTRYFEILVELKQ